MEELQSIHLLKQNDSGYSGEHTAHKGDIKEAVKPFHEQHVKVGAISAQPESRPTPAVSDGSTDRNTGCRTSLQKKVGSMKVL